MSWAPRSIAGGRLPTEPPRILGLCADGARCLILGEPDSGKSWILLCAAAAELDAGASVLFIDHENGPARVADRLEARLGVDLERAEHDGRFGYIEPAAGLDAHARLELGGVLAQLRPSLVCVDGLAGWLSLHGLSDNDRSDVEAGYRLLDDLRATGAAVIVLDHVSKDRENRGRWAIGSERKIGLTDYAYSVEVIEPFGIGRTGRARLRVGKDRDGYRPRMALAGTFTMASAPDGSILGWLIDDAPTDGAPTMPTAAMQAVSIVLEAAKGAPVSARQLREEARNEATGSGFRAATVDAAVGFLVRGRFARHLERERRATPGYVLLAPYREGDAYPLPVTEEAPERSLLASQSA